MWQSFHWKNWIQKFLTCQCLKMKQVSKLRTLIIVHVQITKWLICKLIFFKKKLNKFLKMSSYFWLLSLILVYHKYSPETLKYSAFEIQVISTSAIKCWGDFRIFQCAWKCISKKYCPRLSRNLCILFCQWLQHT